MLIHQLHIWLVGRPWYVCYLHDITPVIIFKYGDDVKTYFFPEAVEATKDDYWENSLKRVMCKTHENMAYAEESDAIGLNISLAFSLKTQ